MARCIIGRLKSGQAQRILVYAVRVAINVSVRLWNRCSKTALVRHWPGQGRPQANARNPTARLVGNFLEVETMQHIEPYNTTVFSNEESCGDDEEESNDGLYDIKYDSSTEIDPDIEKEDTVENNCFICRPVFLKVWGAPPWGAR
ncbi:hypothetical protein TNCV_988601 [Trichonephila clavipes]|nr:hypothetical protein TNCV_988601 [Trichonephila clavipes]